MTGRNVRLVRRAMGISISQFANFLDASEGQVRYWENRVRRIRPHGEALRKGLREFLDLTEADLKDIGRFIVEPTT